MTTLRPRADGCDVFDHAVGLYSGQDEMVDIVAGFVEKGLALGEPVVVAARCQRALRARLPDSPHVEFVNGANPYRRPAGAVTAWLTRFRDHAATRGGRLRIVGEIDPADTFSPLGWEPWARYEAAVNVLYAGFEVSSLCMYDRSLTPDHALADVRRTHPCLAGPGSEMSRNADYQPPGAFMAGRPTPPPDPLQRSQPVVELVDAAPSEARRAVRAVASRSALSAEEVDGLVFAVSEAVANAHTHGRPPVVVRAWTTAERIVLAVCDAGSGPADPFVGLVPSGGDGVHGRGLWIVHQVCSHVVHVRDDEGFQLRVTGVGAGG